MKPSAMKPFEEPLEIIEACHERMERQLRTLERMVPHVQEHGADESARGAAASVMRYFDTSGADHHRDEDEDLFPRLRALAARENRDEIGAAIYELASEHQAMDTLYADLRHQLAALEEGREARLDPDLVERFCWIYRRHITMEKDVILPYARSALNAAQLSELGERMAARRQDRLAA